jgi:adenylate cyclase
MRGPSQTPMPARGRDLHRATLSFSDPGLEAAFRDAHFANVITSVRAAHVLGIATWVLWGLIIRQYTVEAPTVDLVVRFGVLVPIAAAGLVVTSLPVARRVWEAEAVAVLLLTALVWTIYVSAIAGVPFDLGYVGVILIMAFSYTLFRLRFVVMAVAGVVTIALYFVAILLVGRAESRQILLSLYYLISFYALGTIASYTRERSDRLLFLRELQLGHERRRSEGLLLNVLPRVIAERLIARDEAAGDAAGDVDAAIGDQPVLADEHADATVLFADLVGFTEQAARTPPDAVVAALNELFSVMDALADRHGLEKIKTIGDAYLAVAGVPSAIDDPTGRAVGMALELLATLDRRRWPSGDPVAVRVGIASGPVVAGVIGRRKFAYDVWGDTVNLASRLEAVAPAGSVLVAASTADRVADRFAFGPPELIEVKGKGTQAVCRLLGAVGRRGR